jgi:hypothetical protein
MQPLTKREKAHVKIIVILAAVGLLLEGISKKSTFIEGDSPAAQQIGAQIDEILKSYKEDRRQQIIAKVQKTRIRLTKSVKNLQVENAFIGALDVLTDGTVKTKTGTRMDFIVQTFRTNLANIKEHLPYNENEVQEFRKRLLTTLRAV